ncbi:tyrosine-type recombinase/integrase [Rhizobium sp. LjRoot254]|uniref:tyrosine-type recombinase/integrase n=1 Tax=Rhizobium sp. LjRoot254 TaxID=3342297 RepID=UPI003ECD6B7C
MEPIKLTKKSIDQINPPTTDTFYWDRDLKGFGLKAYKSGRKTFILQARLNGNSKRFTIGAYGQPWSPDQAREIVLQMLADVAKGVDPVAKKTKSEIATVSELAEHYLKDAMGHKKISTCDVENGLIKRHILPLLAKRKVAELTKNDLERFLQNVADGKTAVDEKTRRYGRAIVKGGKGTANRTMALLSSMFTYAIGRGVRTDNPAKGIKLFRLKKHDRYLNAEELERLGGALRQVEDAGQSPFAVAAIRFLLLSGCRCGEALTLQWSWIDFDHNIAKLPDSKTGQKVLLLGSGAIDLLKTLAKVAGSPLVFSSAAGGTTPISIQKVWRKVRETAGLDGLRLHDLRHNFASTAVSSGQSLYIVGKLLGHSQSQTTQRYAHLAPDPVRQAADDVSAEIIRKISG